MRERGTRLLAAQTDDAQRGESGIDFPIARDNGL